MRVGPEVTIASVAIDPGKVGAARSRLLTKPESCRGLAGLATTLPLLVSQQLVKKPLVHDCAAITIVHADAPTALAHVTAGRIDELAEYLAGFVAELGSVGAELIAMCAVTPHIALGPLTKHASVPIVDMLEVTAQGLRERGFSRTALFGTRFTVETELFGALDGFDVIPPRPQEIDEIHRVYLELATAAHTSAANVAALREMAKAIRRRDRVDAVVLAGTDLNLIFDEGSAGFPAFDCASAHISTILDRATPGRATTHDGLAAG
jgi:aspartate racemase